MLAPPTLFPTVEVSLEEPWLRLPSLLWSVMAQKTLWSDVSFFPGHSAAEEEEEMLVFFA